MRRRSTNGNEEMLVFLGGRARCVRAESVEVGGGQVLYIQPHTEHEVHNDREAVARYVVTVAPAR